MCLWIDELLVFIHLQVQLGSNFFTFDHVYSSTTSSSSSIYDECVVPLVDALFQGYNATVLAYGQVCAKQAFDKLDICVWK